MTLPCKFDHNGECLICDCWLADCAWERLQRNDFRYETKEQLQEMFKDRLKEKEDATDSTSGVDGTKVLR